MNKWNTPYKNLVVPEPYGDTITYRLGSDWLHNCSTVEDWGCGAGWFRRFCKSQYIGIDGSDTPFLTKKVDLINYRSSVEGIFMRHVLEHNYDWKVILENALDSFSKRMCLILFTPLTEKTTVITTNPGYGDVPDISFSMKELESIFEKHNVSYTYETFKTETQYNTETTIYIEKPIRPIPPSYPS
jgi:hypothetical protein